MNPLTLVKRIQNINSREAALGISEEASWHAKYKDSAYVYVGGIPFDLTEGDLLAVFAQYGEIVDVNLVRDKGTGKSKGFAFVAYEDQRSTNLAVDNLNGAHILGRIVRVDHVSKYKKKEEEDEETEQRKREERGVCRAFQRGNCTRGAGCKFSHDEQRAANTGWGEKDKEPRWGHDKFDGPRKNERKPGTVLQTDKRDGRRMGSHTGADEYVTRSKGCDKREDNGSRKHDEDDFQPKSRGDYDKKEDRRLRRDGDNDEFASGTREEKRSKMDVDSDEFVTKSRDHDKEEEKRSRRYNDHESLPKLREDRERGQERRSIKYKDDEFQSKSSKELDKRGERYSRHDYDDAGQKSKEPDNRREDTRSSRHNDEKFESKSRKDYERSNDKWSRK